MRPYKVSVPEKEKAIAHYRKPGAELFFDLDAASGSSLEVFHAFLKTVSGLRISRGLWLFELPSCLRQINSIEASQSAHNVKKN